MNDEPVEDVHRLEPQGTNSTMFTVCCDTAICEDQPRCPRCNALVIGYDAASSYKRGMIRWRSATQHWNRPRRPLAVKDLRLFQNST